MSIIIYYDYSSNMSDYQLPIQPGQRIKFLFYVLDLFQKMLQKSNGTISDGRDCFIDFFTSEFNEGFNIASASPICTMMNLCRGTSNFKDYLKKLLKNELTEKEKENTEKYLKKIGELLEIHQNLLKEPKYGHFRDLKINVFSGLESFPDVKVGEEFFMNLPLSTSLTSPFSRVPILLQINNIPFSKVFPIHIMGYLASLDVFKDYGCVFFDEGEIFLPGNMRFKIVKITENIKTVSVLRDKEYSLLRIKIAVTKMIEIWKQESDEINPISRILDLADIAGRREFQKKPLEDQCWKDIFQYVSIEKKECDLENLIKHIQDISWANKLGENIQLVYGSATLIEMEYIGKE